jgi:hypothetical protein
MIKPAFEVDKAGLEKLLAQRGKEFAVLELIQNALDENVTNVSVHLSPIARGFFGIDVEDDCPEGFADLSHAYTLFAESKKKTNPEQRGRFNLGEKLVIACCRRATIVTTTGAIEWDGNHRRSLRRRREFGSRFEGELRMTLEEATAAIAAVKRVIVPDGVELTINGDVVQRRPWFAQIEETMPTVHADDEGFLRLTQRKTNLNIIYPINNEQPMLYELGIPVVEIDCPWHVDIQQKVPLNTDRDGVTPGYMRRVLATVLNATYDCVPENAIKGAWVNDALASDLLEDKAVEGVMLARYGDKRVVRDPSDPEATNIAMAKGYSIIEPGSFSREQWGSIRRAGAALPAGQVTPSPKPYSKDGDELNLKSPDDWSPGMRRFRNVACALAFRLMDVDDLTVHIATEVTWPYGATYGRVSPTAGRLVLNLGRLGHRFFDEVIGVCQLRLLIHEFGHHTSSNHLSAEYHDALCKLGSELAFIDVQEIIRASS